MLFLDQTLPSIEENLALDEALLQERESGTQSQEVLRLWDAQSVFIVLGRSSKIDTEVDRRVTTAANIPILRRVSGGATILAAPGCMFYSVLLSLTDRPQLRMLDTAHCYVMSRLLEAITQFEPNAELDGTCDIVLGGRKVSGNSLRVQRNWILYHGTILLDMDLGLVSQFLKHPPREPEYRSGRTHHEFLANLEVTRRALAARMKLAWGADSEYGMLPSQTVRELVQEKYSQDHWNQMR